MTEYSAFGPSGFYFLGHVVIFWALLFFIRSAIWIGPHVPAHLVSVTKVPNLDRPLKQDRFKTGLKNCCSSFNTNKSRLSLNQKGLKLGVRMKSRILAEDV